MNFTHKKMTISGPIVEFDTTQKPIPYGTNYHVKPGSKAARLTNQEESQLKSVYRSKKRVRLLVNANAYQWFKTRGKPYIPIFITFTFKEDIRDIDKANHLYTNFIKKLNYEINKQKKKKTKQHDLQYLAVIEFQDENREGVIHYHTLFFNLPFMERIYDQIKRIWKHGHTNVESLKDIIKDAKYIANYIVKYMSKSLRDGRLKGKKKYFTSRNLLKPKQILDEDIVLNLASLLPENSIISSGSWQNKHCGKYSRTTYNLKNNPEILSLINKQTIPLD